MKTFWEKEKERKKMKKKAVSLLMVAAMMTTMAAGCGNKAANNAGSDAAADNSTTSDAAADNSTTSDAAAEETAGTEAAAADSEDEPWSGTITVWMHPDAGFQIFSSCRSGIRFRTLPERSPLQVMRQLHPDEDL